ncbi:asparaginase [Sutcliffiella rhizosphaerae]|uniref:asparaginase n=1 Tax=Sutcliffiella rhizosphaerae TaxID=2880967 RepID=A0ABM8YU67_9BACI|nr:asparaginase [Sutcliffiella rhizosphaerae]CAG9623508.1 putative L-asparaginase [Sutcliffiella rhizosphaerae]
MKKKIFIIHTGGTISMSEDEQTGAVSPGQQNPLISTPLVVDEQIHIESHELFNLPSPHITSQHMLKLTNFIERISNEKVVDGFVITHGTDTLEETAFFLDLTVQTKVPIVLTGAMRSSNEIGSDGPYNLLSSIKVAATAEASDKGVLVVLNDEIHTAKNVTKTHTSNIATFQSPQYGPIGIVTKRGAVFHHSPVANDKYQVETIHKKVMLLKAYAGMESSIFYLLKETQVDGIILEALGQGNVPPSAVEGIKTLIEAGIPVVMVSRCFNGIVQDIYGYEGGGRKLKELGVIFSNGLNGQKARIKLMIALESTNDLARLQELFLK